MALEAAEGLLSLGVKGVEVDSLMIESYANYGNMEWLVKFMFTLILHVVRYY